MPTRSWKILILGDTRPAEMRSLIAMTTPLLGTDDAREISNVKEVLRLADENWFPDLVIVIQNRPDEFSADDVANLLSAFPLARWICCFGFWCESDGRNRDFWPPAIRISARSAETRIRRELDVLRNGSSALPLTAGREEVFAFDHPSELSSSGNGENIRIVSPDRKLKRWLFDLLTDSGYRPGNDDATGVIWDADPMTPESLEHLKTLAATQPVVVLMNAATARDTDELTAAGVSAVLPKLASDTMLLEALYRLLNRQSSHA